MQHKVASQDEVRRNDDTVLRSTPGTKRDSHAASQDEARPARGRGMATLRCILGQDEGHGNNDGLSRSRTKQRGGMAWGGRESEPAT